MENHTFAIRTKESLEPAKTFSFRYIIILSDKHISMSFTYHQVQMHRW